MSSPIGRTPGGDANEHRGSGAGRQGDTGRSRKPLAVAVLGVAVLVLISGAAVWATGASHRDDPSGHPSATVSAVTGAGPVRSASAPGGGGLRVVESGVSMGENTLGQTMATYGIVLENTSQAQAAFDAAVLVTMVDAAGQTGSDQTAGTGTAGEAQVTATLALAAPGQRVGVGREVYVPHGATVTDLKIQVGEASWAKVGDLRVARLVASQVRTSVDAAHRRATITFTVESGYTVGLEPSAIAIYRDASGAVVGGTSPEDSKIGNGNYPSGTSKQEIRTRAPVPQRADVNRTEVYVYPPTSAFRTS